MPVHVLVVEDDEGIREAVAYGLHNAGYSVVEAADGDAGLEAARGRRPDLILVDLMVPGPSGAQLCRLLRRAAPKVPIVVMTAHVLDPDERSRLGLDELWLVTKPFSMTELFSAIDAAQGGRNTRTS